MATKIIKKKQAHPVWSYVKDIFVSLISNRCAIESSKNHHWLSSIIIGLAAPALALVPILTNIANTQGSSAVFTSNVNDFDHQLTSMLVSLEKGLDKYEFVVSNNEEKRTHELLAYTDFETTKQLYTPDAIRQLSPLATYKNDYLNQYGATLYYSQYNYAGVNNETAASIIEKAANLKYLVGTTTLKDPEVTYPEEQKFYTPSFMVLFRNGIYIAIFKDSSSEILSYTNAFYDWEHTNDGFRIVRDTLIVTDKEGSPLPHNPNSLEYVNGVFANWKSLLNDCYLTTKGRSTGVTGGTFYGVYAAMVLFMGLLLWLMTRGKNNSFNYLKLYECLKMAGWAALSPGLLSMILGFLLAQFAITFFILFMGIRVMWMSMKQLKPQF